MGNFGYENYVQLYQDALRPGEPPPIPDAELQFVFRKGVGVKEKGSMHPLLFGHDQSGRRFRKSVPLVWGLVGLAGWSRGKSRASVGVPCPPSVAPRRFGAQIRLPVG